VFGVPTLFDHFKGGALAVDVFIVSKFETFWGVVNQGAVISRCPTSTSAIRLAVQTAEFGAKVRGPAQIVLEDENCRRTAVWDSRQDGFSEGRASFP
jgi:hypothetical protein